MYVCVCVYVCVELSSVINLYYDVMWSFAWGGFFCLRPVRLFEVGMYVFCGTFGFRKINKFDI